MAVEVEAAEGLALFEVQHCFLARQRGAGEHDEVERRPAQGKRAYLFGQIQPVGAVQSSPPCRARRLCAASIRGFQHADLTDDPA